MTFRTHKTFDERPTGLHTTFDHMAVTGDAVTNDNGHLVVHAFLSRPGVFEYRASEIKPQWPTCDEVQKYPDDAILRAYRAPEELASERYLNSAKLIPVTDNHPPDMLHPDTVAGYPVGVSSEDVKIVDGKPQARLVLWSDKAIRGYHSGKKEISLGAYNQFEWGPGKTSDGQPYDFRITKTVNNHIAIVDAGRAGPTARIFDAAAEGVPRREEKRTMKITIKGATFDVDDNVAALLEKERDEFRATNDRLSGEIEALKNQKPSEAELAKLVDAEIKKRDEAAKLEEQRQVVKDAGFDVEGKSADYIAGIFATIDKSPEKKTDDAKPGATIDTGVRFGGGNQPAVTRDSVERAKAGVYGL